MCSYICCVSYIEMIYIDNSKTHKRRVHSNVYCPVLYLNFFPPQHIKIDSQDVLFIWMILILSHALAVCPLRDLHALWVNPGLPVRPGPNDQGFCSVCGPIQFSLIETIISICLPSKLPRHLDKLQDTGTS